MDYSKNASQETVAKTIAALNKNNFHAEAVAGKDAALARVKELIPAGAEVMAGSSTTLDQIGFTDLLKSGDHPWKNLKAPIMAEKDPAVQAKLRKQSVFSQYWLGSVHAVTEDGRAVTASASGSQLPAYAFTSPNLIWVVGTQKIVPTLEEALKRIHEYTFPLEDTRMKSVGAPGSNLAKILIQNNEPAYAKRNITLIFVNEKLGF
ncbi:MAG TPA: lactate utilization protein [Candidatus Paceibacterota bacterium]|nr:lactate utilization protein [Candidatus Paceibacterota bacterium]